MVRDMVVTVVARGLGMVVLLVLVSLGVWVWDLVQRCVVVAVVRRLLRLQRSG
jgi:hypothetical protein